jgi:hypothetical protein
MPRALISNTGRRPAQKTALLGALFYTLIWFSAGQRAPAQDAEPKARQANMPIEKLLASLDSADGKERAAATAEIFRRGKDALAALRKAGAKQVAPVGGTIATRRLDIVFSLLEGLPPNIPNALSGYVTDSFGLHVTEQTTAADVAALGKKYGFALVGEFRGDGRPNCYVRVRRGSLAEVLTRLLSDEPKVTTVNLNYFVK